MAFKYTLALLQKLISSISSRRGLPIRTNRIFYPTAVNRNRSAMKPIRYTGTFGEQKQSSGISLPQQIVEIRGAITASEVAALLSLSPIPVYKMAKAGRMPSFRVGTAVRFDPRALAEWLRENTF
jgi:excisionase family DNA binding protein